MEFGENLLYQSRQKEENVSLRVSRKIHFYLNQNCFLFKMKMFCVSSLCAFICRISSDNNSRTLNDTTSYDGKDESHDPHEQSIALVDYPYCDGATK